MAHLYQYDGTNFEVFPQSLDTGVFTLKEMQHFVGGYIEMLSLNDNKVAVFNEDGRFTEEPNPLATHIVDLLRPVAAGTSWNLYGNVLIATNQEVGGKHSDAVYLPEKNYLEPGEESRFVSWDDLEDEN